MNPEKADGVASAKEAHAKSNAAGNSTCHGIAGHQSPQLSSAELKRLIASGKRGLPVWAMAPGQRMTLMGPPVSRRKQRALGIAKFQPGLGYDKLPCSKCQKHTWLGPSQLMTLKAEPATEIICLTCLRPQLEEGLRTGKIGMTHLGGRGGSYWHTNGHYHGPPEESQN
jgi:hypothetical protein